MCQVWKCLWKKLIMNPGKSWPLLESTIFRTVVGVAYPGYRSLKALLTEDKTDDMLWLRYWVLQTRPDLTSQLIKPSGCPGSLHRPWAGLGRGDVVGTWLPPCQDGLPRLVHGPYPWKRQQCHFQPGWPGNIITKTIENLHKLTNLKQIYFTIWFLC